MKNINNTWYARCITKLLTLYEFSMHTYNIHNIMLHIIHIQYTYDIEVWFQVQQYETSLQQGQKTNALGKMLFNMFIKMQHFLIYGKSANRGWGWILIRKQNVASYISLSHRCQRVGSFLPCASPEICSLFTYFGLIAFGTHCLPPTYDINQLKCVDS